MLNVVAVLQQRCGNVLITSESDVATTSETEVGTTLIFDSVKTLWQRQQPRSEFIQWTTNTKTLGMCPINSILWLIFFGWTETTCTLPLDQRRRLKVWMTIRLRQSRIDVL